MTGERGLTVLSKRSRQQLIRNVVLQQRVGTQLQLVNTLRALGCDVTQATVSRDMRELGLKKNRDSMGRPCYTLPDNEQRRDPEAAGGCCQSPPRWCTRRTAVVNRSRNGTRLGRVMHQRPNNS